MRPAAGTATSTVAGLARLASPVVVPSANVMSCGIAPVFVSVTAYVPGCSTSNCGRLEPEVDGRDLEGPGDSRAVRSHATVRRS